MYDGRGDSQWSRMNHNNGNQSCPADIPDQEAASFICGRLIFCCIYCTCSRPFSSLRLGRRSLRPMHGELSSDGAFPDLHRIRTIPRRLNALDFIDSLGLHEKSS